MIYVFQQSKNIYGVKYEDFIKTYFKSGCKEKLFDDDNFSIELKKKVLNCLVKADKSNAIVIDNELSCKPYFLEIVLLEWCYQMIYEELSKCKFIFNDQIRLDSFFNDNKDYQIYRNKLKASMLLSQVLFEKFLGNDNGYVYERLNEKAIEAYNVAFPDGKINNINEISIKYIEYLFNFQTQCKYRSDINLGNIQNDAFLSILLSLLKSNKNDKNIDNLTVGDLSKNNEFKLKINKIKYVEINKNIENQNELFSALKLSEKDFNQREIPTYKVFYVSCSIENVGHAIAIIVDTSRSYEEAIKDINSIAKIDSSKATESNKYDFGFFKRIPSANDESYQENNTCYIHATCACSTILNNCQSFNDIVENGKLKFDIENKILDEEDKYYLKNADKVNKEEDYINIGKTKDNEVVKINIKKEDLIQEYDVLLKRIERLKLYGNTLESIVEKYRQNGIDLIIKIEEPIEQKIEEQKPIKIENCELIEDFETAKGYCEKETEIYKK